MIIIRFHGYSYQNKYFYSSNFHNQPSKTEYLSYTLNLSPQSPAIDAGNPDPTLYDPDGTISDIGLYYFDQGSGGQVAAPVADFSTSSVSGSYPLYVEFTSTSSGAIKTDLIIVTSPSLPPIVSFSAEPTAGILPLEVVFSSSIINDVNLFYGILEMVPQAQN